MIKYTNSTKKMIWKQIMKEYPNNLIFDNYTQWGMICDCEYSYVIRGEKFPIDKSGETYAEQFDYTKWRQEYYMI